MTKHPKGGITMKSIKKIAATLFAVAVLALLPNANAFRSQAAEPVTYAVKYVSDEQGWRYQPNTATYDDSLGGGPISILRTELKDGDLVVIYNDLGTNSYLDLGSANLSNLTYTQNTKTSFVFAGSVKDCYVLGGSTGTVNCNVENAYVYDTVVFNFNGNVKEMYVEAGDNLRSSIGSEGTVKHLYVFSSSRDAILLNHYDFVKGALYIQEGVFLPQGAFLTAQDHDAGLTLLPDEAPGSSSASSGEYDDVPKTGQSNLYLWLLCASAMCFAGSRALKRSAK